MNLTRRLISFVLLSAIASACGDAGGPTNTAAGTEDHSLFRSEGGITGLSQAGCGGCHNSPNDPAPTVTISGPTTVAPGATETYTLTVTPADDGDSDALGGGLNVSATAGTFAAGTGTRVATDGDLTQTDTKLVPLLDPVSWDYQWTAAATAGTQTMYGAGISVNLGNGANNDEWNVTTLEIVVQAAQNTPPTADPNGPYTGTVGSPVTFDGSVSNDPDGTIVSYDWDFGDGNTGTGVSPTHTYAAAGTFDVTLTVTDNDGATDTQATTATISDALNTPPTADPNGTPTASTSARMGTCQ
jgi:chitodextrinase